MVQRAEEGAQVTVLIVGARRGSLGAAIKHQCATYGYHAVTAGISGDEDMYLDLDRGTDGSMSAVLATTSPMHVICTVGINEPMVDGLSETGSYQRHFDINVVAPMRLLELWRSLLKQQGGTLGHHYVAISSNSAGVPRSGSAPYCASKAALSMALRVKGREGLGSPVVVYGYEPGLLAATPMTAQTAEHWPGVPLTRMRPEALAQGIRSVNLAHMVVNNLALGPELNGCLFRLDADES